MLFQKTAGERVFLLCCLCQLHAVAAVYMPGLQQRRSTSDSWSSYLAGYCSCTATAYVPRRLDNSPSRKCSAGPALWLSPPSKLSVLIRMLVGWVETCLRDEGLLGLSKDVLGQAGQQIHEGHLSSNQTVTNRHSPGWHTCHMPLC